ncbi:MAG: competence/damage-inducible protein A, partial [Ruminococcaceae bacterium]|nr:competence/damage-inducible protein A [Oscillospiraceae bacterium]
MKAEIISVGDEVLRGDVENVDTSYLSMRLIDLGFSVERHTSVGDNETDIKFAVTAALERSRLIVITGGLGPTIDDMTRESVAKAVDRKLIFNKEIADNLEKRFLNRGHKITENNFRQAMVIEGAELLNNENGTAPGLYLNYEKSTIILLPGPPRELIPMFENEVVPKLELLTDSGSYLITMNTFGIGESALEEELKDLLYAKNPTAALYAKTGEVQIRITARESDAQDAMIKANELASKIKHRLGSFLYSEGKKSLPDVVVELLKMSGAKVAIAESCTGGLVSQMLTDISGSSEVFDYGVVSYGDWIKEKKLFVSKKSIKNFSSVSGKVAEEMAKGVMKEGKADYGVAVTGIAGPGKGDYDSDEVGLVYIAVADKNGTHVKEFHFGDRGREFIRIISAKNAFDMLRRLILGLEIFSLNSESSKKAKSIKKIDREIKSNKKSLFILLVLILALASFSTAYFHQRNNVDFTDDTEMKTKTLSDRPNSASSANPSLRDLLAMNPDTVGWLEAPKIFGYPVVRWSGESESNLMLDERIDLSDECYNIVIYEKFLDTEQSDFSRYLELDFINKNKILSFESILFKKREYVVVSVFESSKDKYYGEYPELFDKTEFEDTADLRDFIIDLKLRSRFETNVDIVTGDRFLTLISQGENEDSDRTVVILRELRKNEIASFDDAIVSDGISNTGEWFDENKKLKSEVETEIERWNDWLTDNNSRLLNLYVDGLNDIVRELTGGEKSAVGETGSEENLIDGNTQTVPGMENPPETGG